MFNKKNVVIISSCILALILIISALFFNKGKINKKTSNSTATLQKHPISQINKIPPTKEKEVLFDFMYNENQEYTKQKIDQEIEIDKDLYSVLNLLDFSVDDIKEKIRNYQFNGDDYNIHVAWINKIKNQLGDKLDKKILAEITENHIVFFYLSNELDRNYLERSDISFEEYKETTTLLFIWNQKIFQEKMSDEDYEYFFGNPKNEAEDIIRNVVNLTPEFQYYNSDVTIEEIYEKVPRWKLDQIVDFSKIWDLDLMNLNDEVNTGKITPEEAVNFAESSSKAYFESAREILDEDEFHLMFASVEKQF